MSPGVAITPQRGQVAPLALIVPAPSSRSCSRFCAALPLPSGTSCLTSNVTPVSEFEEFPVSRVRSTRFVGFLHSQRVLSRGTSARQPLQRTVRAHKYATGGFAIQRGLASSSR